MNHYTLTHKVRVENLVRLAHERELKETLNALSTKFDQWKAGKITSFQMEQALHRFDCDDSRNLWSTYQTTRFDFLLARAVVMGFLSKDEIGPKILKLISDALKHLRNGKATNA